MGELNPEERQAVEMMLGRAVPAEVEEIILAFHDMMATRSPVGIMEDPFLACCLLMAGLRREHLKVKNKHSDTPIGTKLMWVEGQREIWGTFQGVCEKPRGTYCRMWMLDESEFERSVPDEKLTAMVERPKLPDGLRDLPFEPGTEVVAGGQRGLFRSVSREGRLRVEIEESGIVGLQTFDLDEVLAYVGNEDTVRHESTKGWESVKVGYPVTVSDVAGEWGTEGALLDGTFQGIGAEGQLEIYLIERDEDILIDAEEVIPDRELFAEAT